MCLATITSTRTGTNLAVTTVWKTFQLNKTTFCLFCKYPHTASDKKDWSLKCTWNLEDYTDAKIGVWIKATKGRIRLKRDKFYPKGFHAYFTHPKLYGACIIPVEFRCIHTVGTQDRRKVLVAYEMKIPKNWRKYVQ